MNPMLGLRERFVRDWPGPARPDDADAVFAQGWRAAAARAADRPRSWRRSDPRTAPPSRRSPPTCAGSPGTCARSRAPTAAPRLVAAPRTLSASSLVDHARCPKRFYWSVVRPLPRFSGPAARIGTEIHRWIERRAVGQGRLLEPDDDVDLTHEELAGDPGRLERLRQAFLASPYADRAPLFAERAFLLRIGPYAVGGRIDAIFGEPDGPWDVVDWKTGSGDADPLQLELYGLACVEIWGKRPEDLTLSYCYLARDEIVQVPMDDPAKVRARIEGQIAQIEAAAFDPTPGPWCRYCDFARFCDAGTAWLAADRA